MSINPLIPYIPAFLSFFIYGYLSGFLFLLWKRSRWGCLLTIIFWYLYAVWCIWFGILVSVQDLTNQTWFVLGVALAFLRPLLQSAAVQNFTQDIAHAGHLGRWAWQALTRSRTNNTSSDSQSHANQNNQQSQNGYNDTTEQTRRAEQARREAEARARRAEKEKESQQSRAEDSKPEPPTADKRTPEEILGLKAGWTQADLKAIYRYEAGRIHPDKWVGKPKAIYLAMEEEFKNIQRAYDQLKT